MFIDERVTVRFTTPPVREKSPPCPDAFEWNGKVYEIEVVEQEWVDFTRKGRYARNMSDAHLATAATKGSLGVGRFYFQARVTSGERFVIYYDRAPTKQDPRGSWVLYRSVEGDEDGK